MSFRAQLVGWEHSYLPNVEVPGELPLQIAAVKRQHARWSRGSAQCLRKLAWPVLLSRRLRWWQKIMALMDLSIYVVHPLTTVLVLVSPLLLLAPSSAVPRLPLLGLAPLGPLLAVAVAQGHLHPDWWKRMAAFPLLTLLAIGTAWRGATAFLGGLCHTGGTFRRTPKHGITRPTEHWSGSRYRLQFDTSVAGEIILAAYAVAAAGLAAMMERFNLVPIALAYALGFGSVIVLELGQSWVAWRRSRPNRPADQRAKRR